MDRNNVSKHHRQRRSGVDEGGAGLQDAVHDVLVDIGQVLVVDSTTRPRIPSVPK
jgi:hypothetical protein